MDTVQSATCGHCEQPQRGYASVNDTPLCHPDNGPDCYRLVTVYQHPMPCPCSVVAPTVWAAFDGIAESSQAARRAPF